MSEHVELLVPRDWQCAHGVVYGLAGACERCTMQQTLRAVGSIDGEPVGELVPTLRAGERIDEQGRRWYSAAWL